MLKPTAALALCLATATPALALDDPDQLVRSLYAREALPTSARDTAWFYAADLNQALKADSSRPGEVGAVDFDFRYGAQDFDVTGLKFSKTHQNSNATVAASFVNFGKPMTIVYRMCLGRTGWKIADVSDGEGAWRLRAVLKLPSAIRC